MKNFFPRAFQRNPFVTIGQNYVRDRLVEPLELVVYSKKMHAGAGLLGCGCREGWDWPEHRHGYPQRLKGLVPPRC